MSLLPGATLNSSFDEQSWGSDIFLRSSLHNISQGYYSLGSISSSLDHDYYQFSIVSGYSYTISLTSDSTWYGWSTFRNSSFLEFDIVDSIGSVQLSSTSSGLYDDSVTFTANTSGTYYVDVHGLEFSGADYALTISSLGASNSTAVFHSPTYTGSLIVDEIITANISYSDLDGNSDSEVFYNWFLEDENLNQTLVDSDTDNTYTIQSSDIGSKLLFSVSFFDDLGNWETSQKYYAGSGEAIIEKNTEAEFTNASYLGAVISGETINVSIDYSDPNGNSDEVVFYSWYTEDEEGQRTLLSTGSSSSYSLTENEVGNRFLFGFSFYDDLGYFESSSLYYIGNDVVEAPNSLPTGTVEIIGTASQGETLSVSNSLDDSDGMGAVSYQWQSDGEDLEGETSDTLVLTQDQVGQVIMVVASYTDGGGMVETVASGPTAAVANTNDSPTGAVSIGGSAIQGETLTALNTLQDEDGLGEISYQWQANGVDITGATNDELILTQVHVGSTITVTASYTDTFGAAESKTSSPTSTVTNSNDDPTGSVTITGTPTQGETLTAANDLDDPDGNGTISYQWLADGVEIEGAEDGTLDLTQALVGSSVSVIASYIDAWGTAESVASETLDPVENINDLPTGGVTISGKSAAGDVVTADNTLDDLDGLGEFIYQWYMNGALIEGADESSYLVLESDIDSALVAEISYTDGYGTFETVLSDTVTVTAPITAEIVDDDGNLWDSRIQIGENEYIEAPDAQVYRSYYGALGRLPDKGGYDWWLNEINEGRHTLASMASGFIWSDEFKGYADTDLGKLRISPIQGSEMSLSPPQRRKFNTFNPF